MIRHITFDAHDARALAAFWAEVTGYRLHPESDETEAYLEPGLEGHPGLLFVRVDDKKTAKNRVHLDIQPDLTRDAEVERLLALGASIHEDHRRPDGLGWVTMLDPEGNELCIERSSAERAETA